MIDKVNFYDFYGYILPGFVLVALLWLPFSWLGGSWPSVELDSAVAILLLSYVLGFVLQSIATDVLASTVRVTAPSNKAKLADRYPSDYILDPEDHSLSKTLKSELRDLIKAAFKLDVADPTNREDAFRACRAALVARKLAGYTEQAQGMYSLARGVFCGLAIAIPFYAGWGLSMFRNEFTNWHHWRFLSASVTLLLWVLLLPWKDPLTGRRTTSRTALTAVIAVVLFGTVVIAPMYLFEVIPSRALVVALPLVLPALILIVERKRLTGWLGRTMLSVSMSAGMIAIGFDCAGRQLGRDDAMRVVALAIGAVLLLPILHRAYRRFAFNFAMTTYRDFYSIARMPAAGKSSPSSSD